MSRMPAQLVLFGPQGSGKGTQAELLAERLGAALIGAGDLLREIAREDTPAGREVGEIVAAGQLVPDDLISGIVTEQLSALPEGRGFVLEGYPRTVRQSEQLKGILEDQGRPVGATMFISLDADREILKQRLLKRRRHDDTEAVIEERLRLYDERTAPILEAVAAWASVLHVNGDQPVENVTEEIINRISNAKAQA